MMGLIEWLYGCIAIASLSAFVIWTVLFASRPFDADFAGFKRDTFWWIAMGNMEGCIGTFGLSIFRAYAIVFENKTPNVAVDATLTCILLAVLFKSRMSMIWASSINHGAVRWYGTVILLLLWTAMYLYLRQ